MSRLQVASLVAGLVGLSLVALDRGRVRGPRSIESVRRAMYGVLRDGVDERAGIPIVTGAVRRGLGGDARSLHLVGLTVADVASRTLSFAGIAFVAVIGGSTAFVLPGLLPWSLLWFVLAAAAAAVAGWTVIAGVRARVDAQRRAVRRAAHDVVQLVAVALTTDQSVEEALRFAVEVVDVDGADVLRDRLLSAPLRGVPAWEVLDDIGVEYDVRELCELASSLERQGLHGVSIGETVASLAAVMRARSLDQLERDADAVNANLAGPTIGFVVATVAFLAYPLAIRIREAFGG